MSSEDDSYYVDLYERHTEARSGRRARRRGSGGTESGRRRYGGHGRGSGPKSRRSQPWIGQNSARAAVLCGIFLLALYELAVLQDSMKAGELSKGLQGGAAGSKVDTLKHSQNTASEAGLTSKVSRSKLPKPPPAPEPETAAQNPDNSEDSGGNASTETTSKEPSGAGAVAAASQPPSTAPPPPPPPPRPPSQPEAPASIADSTPAPKRPPAELPGYPPRVKRDGEDSSPRRKKKQRRARTRENPTDNETKPSSSVTNLEDSAADSNAEEKRPPASSERSHSSSPGKEETEGSPKKKRPRKVDSPPGGESGAGAEPGSKENFWKWFQESKESEGSGASSIECPEENQKLCQMFYKFIRKYKIRSIYDASCAKNLGWIDVPLKKVGNELWGFKYHCGEVEPEKLEEAKSKLSEFSFVEFDNRQWWKAGFPEGIELLFAWDTLAHTAFGRVWSFFVNVRKQEIKWVLVDNYPGIMNNPSPKREFINLRKHPFRFPAPAAVVQDVREPGEDDSVKRQLLLYEGSSLPDNLG